MKTLIALTILGFTAEAAAESRAYNVKATQYRGTYNQTCNAKKRMLEDKHTFVYDGKDVLINGLKWDFEQGAFAGGSIPGDSLITFHAGNGQKTSLQMSLYINDRTMFGIYTLLGVTAKGELCSDVVEIRGTRR
jgi:hypothetical protein